MMMKRNTTACIAMLSISLAMLAASTAQAAIILDSTTVDITSNQDWISLDFFAVTVTAGAETTGQKFNVDVDPAGFTVTLSGNQNIGGNNYLILENFSPDAGITAFTLTPTEVADGFEDIDIVILSNSVTMNVRGTWGLGDNFRVDLTTTAVPEPSSAALLGLALVGLVSRRRRNRG